MSRIPETYTDNGVTYHISRTSRRLISVSISVSSDGSVKLTVPLLMPLAVVKRLVKNKERWILKHIYRVRKGRELNKLHQEGKVLYRGLHYPLETQLSHSALIPSLSFNNTHFTLRLPRYHDMRMFKATLEKYLKRWYLKVASRLLLERATYYSEKLGIVYSELKVKEVSSIWGSCSYNQKLSFNWKLILTPPEVLDYVVIHEVCHMKYKNHGESFWRCVAAFDPLYNTRRRWLKTYSSGLDIGDNNVS